MLQPPEPKIAINDFQLSEGEALTVRVALENFAFQLTDKEFRKGLGEKLADNYLDRIRDIRMKMFVRRKDVPSL